MRLLNAEFMTLESFNSKSDRPSYAILSHTWNENELIFEDLYTDDFTNLPGFSKVKQSCEQALRDGHSHIWIDTCCIDKRSSSELSEAINSMFQWYGEALECFAFLQDVYDYSDIEEFKWCPENYILTSTQLQKLKNSQFAKSRYWTRGWTLPEVIAPNSVVFYDHNFQRIGSRDELRRVVSVITGINENMFWEHVKLEEFSIATRMSWASNRETTRLEDMAYSLLGIFGIHMPMLYGEGKQAFVRLQEEIIKNSRDHSIFAWEGEVYSSNSNGFLFAQSPSAFRHSDNVISLQHWNTASEYTLTNAGLKIRLPLLPASERTDLRDYSSRSQSEEGRWFAPLACRFETNFSGFIGVELEETKEKDTYIIHHRFERLVILDMDSEEASRRMKSILIQKGTIRLERNRIDHHFPHNKKCVVRWKDNPRLRVTDRWPNESWNEKHDLFWNKHDGTVLGGIRLSTAYYPADGLLDILLRIGYEREGWGPTASWVNPWISLESIGLKSIEEICEAEKQEDFEPPVRETAQKIALPGSKRILHAEIRSQEILQEEVFLVELWLTGRLEDKGNVKNRFMWRNSRLREID